MFSFIKSISTPKSRHTAIPAIAFSTFTSPGIPIVISII